MITKIDQSQAVAEGDVVAGNKSEVNLTLPSMGRVEKLLNGLRTQIEENDEVIETIEALGRYHSKHPDDDIVGLEHKLKAAGRGSEYLEAIRQKERFAMLLQRYSMYSTAQQIFAHFLAKADVVFRTTIKPKIGDLSDADINDLVNTKIVDSIVEECGADEILSMDYDLAHGMIYWLAEQCYIRWHK